MIRSAALLSLGLALGGCTISGGGLSDMVDDSIQTGSITKTTAPAPEPDQLSDSRTVRNAVSAANVERVQSQPLAWSNADTGASGEITAIREVREGNRICRSFQTSRQRFDGIALYNGEACTQGQGQWVLTRFAEGKPQTSDAAN
ncbi:RT0821/Lpp0805 family surface protein [Mangrovibrevibacter kandeliae]|uniref:RT0821/Lpp0805 family surface protein n=1 Tax=Mangrovibrevibacter kandeliae TaxID=2968473 RepID=UPI00211960C3|nr:RT0821/Lpp0805 family surface protein [Aurantimonas sp. CSK15Z-1]MCQ8780720.1 RT0821/Lpp0805 family surface protein [Aurantimonas sp. CSK15Z-1]